jgi:hypothetical protein
VECLKWRNCICILCLRGVVRTAGRRLGTFAFCFRTSDVASGRLLAALLRGTATAEFLSCVKNCRMFLLRSHSRAFMRDKPRRNNAAAYVLSSLIHLFFSLIHLFFSLVHLFSSLIHLFSSLIHLFSSLIHPFSSLVHPFSSLVHPFSSLIHLFCAMKPGGNLRFCSHHAMQQEKPCSMLHGRLGLFVVLFCVSRSQH